MRAAFFFLAVWIGTWATSPVNADRTRSFEDQTLRQIVHVSIGGSQVRVRFTNRFGEVPVQIAQAAIAVEGRTSQSLTFMNRPSISIPPNADVYSDAVVMKVPARSDLVIDTYFRAPSGPATGQNLAYQTNYYAAGDRAGQASMQGFTAAFTGWYFLAEVDVAGSAARGAVVAFGDSITGGAGGKMDANDRWPDFLAARLLALPPDRQLGVLNEGISGNRILLSSPAYGENALARMDSDVLSASGIAGAIVLLGVNDIQQTPHEHDPARIEQGLQQIVRHAHARGVRVTGCTITPYQGWFSYEDAGEATRLAVNHFIRESGTFDAVCDFDAALRDPKNVHRLLPAYDSGDHLHPNADGHRVMASIVDLTRL